MKNRANTSACARVGGQPMQEGKSKYFFPLFCLFPKLKTPRCLNYASIVGEVAVLNLQGYSVLKCCLAHGAVLFYMGSLRSY